MVSTDKSLVLIHWVLIINKVLSGVALETLLGDPCICEGRCKECVLTLSHKICKLCSGFYGIDFKNLGIDSSGAGNELQMPRRTCVCPADFKRVSADNQSSSEIIFVRLECGAEPVDKRFCVGINPQLFLIGSDFAEYWIIIGSLVSIVIILCCALYSLFKNNWCFTTDNLFNVYGQSFPLSIIAQSRVNSFQSLNIICNDTNNQIAVDMRTDSSLPPTYEEIFAIRSDCEPNSTLDKPVADHCSEPSLSKEILPSYEEVMASRDTNDNNRND